MAAKIILSMDGLIIKEYPLNKDRMTIGRHVHNEIVIDNLAVSGEHAVIVTIQNDSFLEDLDSTNGLEVNGLATKKHFLQNNDLIEIGKYKLKYINDQITHTSSAEFEKTMVLRAPVKPVATGSGAVKSMETAKFTTGDKTGAFEKPVVKPPAPPAPAPATALRGQETTQRTGVIQVLSGPNAGKELELVKNLTTLGKPGFQVAVLTRRPHGYFITYVEGESFPLVNGKTLSNQPQQLNDRDVIELAGIKMEFYLKG